MVSMFSLGWSVPPIAYKLHSLNDLPEIALTKTYHVAPKKPQFRFSTVLTKKNVAFGFGSVTVTALENYETRKHWESSYYLLQPQHPGLQVRDLSLHYDYGPKFLIHAFKTAQVIKKPKNLISSVVKCCVS